MTADDPDDVDPFDDDAPPAPVDGEEEPEHSPVADPADPLFGGIDVAALAGERVETAVNKAIGNKIDQLAAEAVAKALTPDLLAQLTAEADEAAQIAVRGRQDAAPAATEPDTAEEPPPLYYGSLNEFVRDYLRHVYRRKIDGTHTFWSPRWWTSDEALARLEAMWLAWEHLRLDNTTGPSVWWRDHADHHMSVLMSSAGPFSKEVDVRGVTIREPLPHEEPPPALFPDVREPRPGVGGPPPRGTDPQAHA